MNGVRYVRYMDDSHPFRYAPEPNPLSILPFIFGTELDVRTFSRLWPAFVNDTQAVFSLTDVVITSFLLLGSFYSSFIDSNTQALSFMLVMNCFTLFGSFHLYKSETGSPSPQLGAIILFGIVCDFWRNQIHQLIVSFVCCEEQAVLKEEEEEDTGIFTKLHCLNFVHC